MQRLFRILPEAVADFCREALNILDQRDALLSVIFVDSAKIRELNRRFRAKDAATDVLSFGYGREVLDGHPFLGEIVLSPEIAWRQAWRWHGSPEREIRKLLIHGILHLLGYDHETDAGEMNRLQRNLMRRTALRRTNPLAEARNAT